MDKHTHASLAVSSFSTPSRGGKSDVLMHCMLDTYNQPAVKGSLNLYQLHVHKTYQIKLRGEGKVALLCDEYGEKAPRCHTLTGSKAVTCGKRRSLLNGALQSAFEGFRAIKHGSSGRERRGEDLKNMLRFLCK